MLAVPQHRLRHLLGEGHSLAAIALGANLGDRYGNFLAALARLPELGVEVVAHSRLYESAPALVTAQPPFLNAAVLAATRLSPPALLDALKRVEGELGRDFAALRYGPRPLDLDIIAFGGVALRSARLTLPHPAWRQRPFVQAPLADLGRCLPLADPLAAGQPHGLESSLAQMAGFLGQARPQGEWGMPPGDPALDGDGLACVLPLLRKKALLNWQKQPLLMGILNVTPDSFSDGGRLASPNVIRAQAARLVAGGATLLDVGGQSTRPRAPRVSPAEELARVLPALQALRGDAATAGAVLSVDTFCAAVAEAAVRQGADIVNDVSGGALDPAMLPTVARLGVPYVAMHMRGEPATMQGPEHTRYGDVVAEVARELDARVEAALQAGIERWRLVLDPGIGFSKTPADQLRLLGSLPELRRHSANGDLPLLVGASRKAFLGGLTGEPDAARRDTATAATTALAVRGGANIIRVHSPEASRQAAQVAHAVRRAVEAGCREAGSVQSEAPAPPPEGAPMVRSCVGGVLTGILPRPASVASLLGGCRAALQRALQRPGQGQP